MIVLQWVQHRILKVVKYLIICFVLLLLQGDSYWQLLYHGLLLNYMNLVMLSQFMNGTQLYRHGVCIFKIAVHWCKELA